MFTGLPPHIVPDFITNEQQEKLEWLLTPEELRFHRLQHTLSTALVTLTGKVHERYSLEPLIAIFDSELLEHGSESTAGFGTFYFLNTCDPWGVTSTNLYLLTGSTDTGPLTLSAARLHVQTFALFDRDLERQDARLLQVLQSAICFIDTCVEADKAREHARYSPESFYRTLSLACCIILRICRCDTRLGANFIGAEQSYFKAVQLFKKRSIQNNDINARSATIITQLWGSGTIFKQADGTCRSLFIRVRNRGVSSSLHLPCIYRPYLSAHVARVIVYGCCVRLSLALARRVQRRSRPVFWQPK